jgi:hypothetical protein
MLIKFLLKIWPALIPIMVYIFWIYVIDRFLIPKILKKKTDIEGEKIVGGKTTAVEKLGVFSLKNRCFVVILYMSLVLAILTLITFAFNT